MMNNIKQEKEDINRRDIVATIDPNEDKINVTVSELVGLVRFADYLEYADKWCVEAEGCITPIFILRNETIYDPVTHRGNPWFVITGRIVYERLKDAQSVTHNKSPHEIVNIVASTPTWNLGKFDSLIFLMQQEEFPWSNIEVHGIRCESCRDDDNHPSNCLWEPWNKSWQDYLIYIELLSPEDVLDPANK